MTGEPIDWPPVETAGTGMLQRGVIDIEADWMTGMMHGRILGVTILFRPFSERTIAPREAGIYRGCSPQFWRPEFSVGNAAPPDP